jgi:hypothetical protein
MAELARGPGMGYRLYMKAIQVTMDEELLAQIDQDAEARSVGRSAFLRNAAAAYLRKRRERTIDEAYARGYAASPPTDEEFGPFGSVVWPDE